MRRTRICLGCLCDSRASPFALLLTSLGSDEKRNNIAPYICRDFIMNDCFALGGADSAYCPLCLRRETLQQNNILCVIKTNLSKNCLVSSAATSVEKNDYEKLCALFGKHLPHLFIMIIPDQRHLVCFVMVSGIGIEKHGLFINCAMLHPCRGTLQRNLLLGAMGTCVTTKCLLSSAEITQENGDYEMLLVVEEDDYRQLHAPFVKYVRSLAMMIKTYLAFIVVVASIDKTQYVLSIICAILHLRRGAVLYRGVGHTCVYEGFIGR